MHKPDVICRSLHLIISDQLLDLWMLLPNLYLSFLGGAVELLWMFWRTGIWVVLCLRPPILRYFSDYFILMIFLIVVLILLWYISKSFKRYILCFRRSFLLDLTFLFLMRIPLYLHALPQVIINGLWLLFTPIWSLLWGVLRVFTGTLLWIRIAIPWWVFSLLPQLPLLFNVILLNMLYFNFSLYKIFG